MAVLGDYALQLPAAVGSGDATFGIDDKMNKRNNNHREYLRVNGTAGVTPLKMFFIDVLQGDVQEGRDDACDGLQAELEPLYDKQHTTAAAASAG